MVLSPRWLPFRGVALIIRALLLTEKADIQCSPAIGNHAYSIAGLQEFNGKMRCMRGHQEYDTLFRVLSASATTSAGHHVFTDTGNYDTAAITRPHTFPACERKCSVVLNATPQSSRPASARRALLRRVMSRWASLELCIPKS